MADSKEVEIMPGVFFTPKQASEPATSSTPASMAVIQRESMLNVIRSTLEDVLSIATAAVEQRDIQAATVLEAEVARLENSIGHLERSNAEMEEHLEADASLAEDMDSNRVIVLQQQLRICALKQLVKGETIEDALASVSKVLDRCIEQRKPSTTPSALGTATAADAPAENAAMWL